MAINPATAIEIQCLVYIYGVRSLIAPELFDEMVHGVKVRAPMAEVLSGIVRLPGGDIIPVDAVVID